MNVTKSNPMGHQKQMRENVRMNCRQSGCRVWRKIADVEIRLVREMINMNELIILNMIVPVFQSPTPQPTSLKNLTPVLGLMSACLNVWRETRQRGGGVAAAEANITSLCCLEKLIHESNLKGQRGALGQVLSKQIGFVKKDFSFFDCSSERCKSMCVLLAAGAKNNDQLSTGRCSSFCCWAKCWAAMPTWSTRTQNKTPWDGKKWQPAKRQQRAIEWRRLKILKASML